MQIPFQIHCLLAILTLVVLMAASVQALILAWQERCLRQQSNTKLLRNFPPLQTMEKWLFRIITVGFLLLTLLIVTGIYFYHNAITLPLIQKIILAVIAWIIFALLLIGRHYLGWRGRKAIYGTLFGALLILLIYLGSIILLGYLL